MRKVLLLAAMILTVFIAGCASDDKGDNDVAKNKDSVEYVSPAHILDRIENEDTFAFILGDATCSACNQYKATTLPKMQEELGVTLEFVELHGIENRKQDEKDIVTLIEEHLDGEFGATPTTYFMVDGELVDIIVGASPYDELVEAYETHILDSESKSAEESDKVTKDIKGEKDAE